MTLKSFMKSEAASGVLLILAAALALVAANSRLAGLYGGFLDVPVSVRVGAMELAKPLLLWINDGLMAIFFLLIGLEVKREVLAGRLSQPSQAILPVSAAVGGMLVPALCYVAVNRGNAMRSPAGQCLPLRTSPSPSVCSPCWVNACRRRSKFSSWPWRSSTTSALS